MCVCTSEPVRSVAVRKFSKESQSPEIPKLLPLEEDVSVFLWLRIFEYSGSDIWVEGARIVSPVAGIFGISRVL